MPEQQRAPIVRAKNRGQVTTTLERYQRAFEGQNPDMTTRYVYAPEHKPELSNVMGREASGYRLVKYKELGLTFEGMKPEATVRVADLVLMAISKEESARLFRQSRLNAEAQLGSVQRKYYDDIQQIGEAHRKEGTRPGTAPVGSATIATKDFAYDVEQRGGDG